MRVATPLAMVAVPMETPLLRKLTEPVTPADTATDTVTLLP